MMTDTVLKNTGMEILIDKLGLYESERFITLMLREPFDYTKWHGMWQSQFDDMSVEDVSAMAMRSACGN
jgi:hypothetical protein